MEGTRPTEETHLLAGAVQGGREGRREGRRSQSPGALVVGDPQLHPGVLLP